MKRLILLLFALLLPVQFAWAGAAAYCEHETTPAETRHFGHHEHVHSTESSTGSKLAIDVDCGICHAAGPSLPTAALRSTVVSPSSEGVVPHPSRPVPTTLARAPDRPQWPRLA